MKPFCPNPNGIASHSPGLERSDYPGWRSVPATTPTGLWHTVGEGGHNPFRVGIVRFTMTQGSPCRAALGWRTESRWDSRTDAPQARDPEQTIAGFSLSRWERVGVRVRPVPNVAEILEA